MPSQKHRKRNKQNNEKLYLKIFLSTKYYLAITNLTFAVLKIIFRFIHVQLKTEKV